MSSDPQSGQRQKAITSDQFTIEQDAVVIRDPELVEYIRQQMQSGTQPRPEAAPVVTTVNIGVRF